MLRWLLVNRFAWGFPIHVVNEIVCSFSRSQLVWLLCEQHWLSLAASPMVLVGFPWFRPDEPWSPAAERGNTFAGCTARVPKEAWAVVGVYLASLKLTPASKPGERIVHHLGCPQWRKVVSALKLFLIPALSSSPPMESDPPKRLLP